MKIKIFVKNRSFATNLTTTLSTVILLRMILLALFKQLQNNKVYNYVTKNTMFCYKQYILNILYTIFKNLVLVCLSLTKLETLVLTLSKF